MLIVRPEGRLDGNRGDRNGDAGADVDESLFGAGTFKLRFLAFRGRFGGEGDLRIALG